MVLIADDSAVYTPEMTVKQTVAHYARVYGVKRGELEKVIKCESNWSESAIGDHGKAHNIAQFHEDTFLRWSKQMGETLNWDSAHDQAKVMAWAFSKGYKSSWTCSH